MAKRKFTEGDWHWVLVSGRGWTLAKCSSTSTSEDQKLRYWFRTIGAFNRMCEHEARSLLKIGPRVLPPPEVNSTVAWAGVFDDTNDPVSRKLAQVDILHLQTSRGDLDIPDEAVSVTVTYTKADLKAASAVFRKNLKAEFESEKS